MSDGDGSHQDRGLTPIAGSSRGRTRSVPARVLRGVFASDYFILYLTAAYFIILAVFFPDLASARNLSNQVANVWPLFVVALGQTFVITIAGIDLSQGAIMGFVSVIGAAFMATVADPLLLGGSPLWGWLIDESGGLLSGSASAVPVAIAVMLITGCLIGLANGYFVGRFGMPAFMVTLVSLIFFSSAAVWLTQSQNIVGLPAEFTEIGAGDLVSFYFGERAEPMIRRRDILPFVTYPMVAAITIGILAHLLLTRTVFGRHVYAIGTNLRAAEVSGVPVRRVIILVFMISGLCAAAAAILYSARLEGGRPTIGAGAVLLDIIGATVIGGTSLAGGKSKVAWTFMGVVFFVLLGNTLNYMGLSAFHIDVVKGGVILAAAVLNIARTRLLGVR